MKAKFYNNKYDQEEIIDTDNLENDSGENWTEESLKQYILDVCPTATKIEIL